MTPAEAMAHVTNDVAAVYPPGVLVDRLKAAAGAVRSAPTADPARAADDAATEA